MILSHRHRLVFIKGVKVASTSVEVALSQLCGPLDIVTAMFPADERLRLGTAGEARNYSWSRWIERRYLRRVRDLPIERYGSLRPPRSRFYPHMPLSEVLELEPQAGGYEVLYVTRSPYSKVLSQANWERGSKDYRIGTALPRTSEGLAEAVDTRIADGSILFANNIGKYRHPDGSIRGTALRFEHLRHDLAEFLRARGLPEVSLPHTREGIGSEALDPMAVLRRDQIEYINRAFAEEFEAFGHPMLAPG
ncbi:hypothetical protein [Sphingomonas sp.]|uniref:hypothetical protein n=1 Tax=Sphingomonas sp. TaxID=28214 RepID=UPI001B0F94D2|nr:hypothetical protein [Sphingomonas sp.]MBO9713394.1 hypothetical protein [Sphingomonas sp.]